MTEQTEQIKQVKEKVESVEEEIRQRLPGFPIEEKGAVADVRDIDRQLKSLREALAQVTVDSARLNEDFQTLDAVTLLAELKVALQGFVERYGGKIDLLAEVAARESELLEHLTKALETLV